MQSGHFHTQVTIERPGDTQDDLGGLVTGWTAIGEPWANILYLSGMQTIKAEQPVSAAKVSIRIRAPFDVDATCRVRHETTIYAIEVVLPDIDRGRFIDLVCITGENNG